MLIVINILTLICIYQCVTLLVKKRYNISRRGLIYRYYGKLGELLNQNAIKRNNLLKIITVVSVICILIFTLVYSMTNIVVTSLILSIPFAIAPYIILKLRIEIKKQKIRKLLPIYSLNLKGKLEDNSNIILAIKRTKVEEPIQSIIKEFVKNVELGMPTYMAFEKLKDKVNIKEFAELINSFQTCLIHGGNFTKVLDIYTQYLSTKLMEEEKEKEKIMSSVLVLIVMMILDILLLFGYVFGNAEFSNIFRHEILGRIIIDINSLSLIACGYVVLKLYKKTYEN